MAIGIKRRQKDDEKLPTRYYSSIQESAVAKSIGGRKTANSGATDFGGKSDVSIHGLFNIECKTKTTNSDSISIKKEWVEKNKRESVFDGNKYSAIAFNFGPNQDNYYIIDEFLFKELVEHLKE